MLIPVIHIDRKDNVVSVCAACHPGDKIVLSGEKTVIVRDAIPRGHKAALVPIPKGSAVYKFGVIIARAACDIPEGSHVHTHNVEDITQELCQERNAAFRAEVFTHG